MAALQFQRGCHLTSKMINIRPNNLLSILLSTAILLILAVPADSGQPTTSRTADELEAIRNKSEVTILLTDSGLGGLSVVAEIENHLEQCHLFKQVHLVFANALPSNDRPYNRMSDMSEKAAVFSHALDGFIKHYQPDIILIACNTLSVVYPYTEFSDRSPVPVLGIVDFGVDLIDQHLTGDSLSSVIIVGTPTTAESGAHRQGLLSRGVSADRITVQGCDMLESEIQANPESDIVGSMIEMYALEAADSVKSEETGDVVVALCCTHYGFARRAFSDVFSRVLGKPVTVVDPNTAMAAALFTGADCSRYGNTAVNVDVVSRAELSSGDIEAIAHMIEPTSAVTAEALRKYTFDENLFED